MSQPIVVTVPIQVDRLLTPNGRGHWAVKRRAQQDAQTATYYALHNANVEMALPIAPPVTLHYLIAHGKGRKQLDMDNAIAAMKPVQDQIAEYIGINDRHFRVGSMTQTRDKDGKGFIRIVIESEEETAT